MVETNLTQQHAKNAETIAAVAAEAGVNLKDCYQCGKCSAGCPAVSAMDLVPRQVIRCMQLGLWDEVLHSKSPWVCATCGTCLERCPQSVDLPSLMEVIRQHAKKAGVKSIREVDTFNDLFLKNVKSFGKSHELMLTAFYNLKTGHLLQDAPNAPHLYTKGMIRLRPHTVRDREAVRKIMNKCLQGGAK